MIRNEGLEAMATQLFGMTEADMETVTPEMEEEPLDTTPVTGGCRLVAEVASAKCCFGGLAPGQEVVVDDRIRVNAQERSAPLCLGVPGPLMDKANVLADRMHHKAEPTAHVSGFRCVDPGLDPGGLGTAEFTVRVEKKWCGGRFLPRRRPACWLRLRAAVANRVSAPGAPDPYACGGDDHIAHHVFGDGPDLVVVPGSVSGVEIRWEVPPLARFLRRLAAFSASR